MRGFKKGSIPVRVTLGKIFLAILTLNSFLYGQTDTDTIFINSVPCVTIDEIKNRNPDSVEAIFLWSKQLKTIPKEVLMCEKLIYLDLANRETEDNHLNDLGKIRRRKVERIIKRNKDKIFDDKEFDFFHPNRITSLPEDFFNLKNLKLLDVTGLAMSKKIIKEIRKRMPNCYVLANDFYGNKWCPPPPNVKLRLWSAPSTNKLE